MSETKQTSRVEIEMDVESISLGNMGVLGIALVMEEVGKGARLVSSFCSANNNNRGTTSNYSRRFYLV